MIIKKEKEVCEALNLPSIPKKEWDGQKPFKTGVAIVSLDKFDPVYAYAVATFDPANGDKEPKVTKVFTTEPFFGIKQIYIVPDYMNDNVESMDLDEESKQAAQRLLDEAKDLENDGVDNGVQLPENEYFFDFINSDDEGMAFIKDYNKRHRIKGRQANTHDAIIMRLSVIYMEEQNKNKKRK